MFYKEKSLVGSTPKVSKFVLFQQRHWDASSHNCQQSGDQWSCNSTFFSNTTRMLPRHRISISEPGSQCYIAIIFYSSDSQPGCRKEMSGVPPKFELLPYYWCIYYIRYRKIVILNQLGVLPDFFKDLTDAANQKRLKNTVLQRKHLYPNLKKWFFEIIAKHRLLINIILSVLHKTLGLGYLLLKIGVMSVKNYYAS